MLFVTVSAVRCPTTSIDFKNSTLSRGKHLVLLAYINLMQPDGQEFICWTGRSSRLSYGMLHYTCRRFLWTIILAAIDSSEPFSPSGAFKTTKEVPRPRKQDQDFPAPRPRLPTLPDRHTSQISCSSQSRWPVVPPSEDARYALALRYLY